MTTKPPMDFKVIRPFEYVRAEDTDIRKTFDKEHIRLGRLPLDIEIKTRSIFIISPRKNKF